VSSTQSDAPVRDFTVDSALDLVLATVANTPDARRKRLFELLLQHLYAFVVEAKPTQQEWRAGLDFLKRTGQFSTEVRDEFGLIDALLGTEMFVEMLNSRRPAAATPNSVLGPFYHEQAPRLPYLADIRGGMPGEPAAIFGQVRSLDGKPIDCAEVDIWQTDTVGLYDVQKPGAETHLRGRFRTGADGRYGCIAVIAKHYDVPTDGPGGEMLRSMGRQAGRPAHVHMRVRAAGHDELITSIFPAGDPLIGSDAAFGVRSALVRPYEPATAADAERFGLALPFRTLEFDVTMAPL
jgi:protocatechuate 3,4-dioxygenase beta subunit